MRICVLSQCTAKKAVDASGALVWRDFQQGPGAIAEKERGLANRMRPAREMYAGEQHVRLRDSLDALLAAGTADGDAVSADFWLLSAGYGVVAAGRLIAPYACSFQALPLAEARRWAEALGVPADVRRLLAAPYDLGLVLLGRRYLSVCDLNADLQLGGQTLLFCGRATAPSVPTAHGLQVVACDRSDTTRFGCGQVGLKGELAARLFTLLRTRSGTLVELLKAASRGSPHVLNLLASLHESG